MTIPALQVRTIGYRSSDFHQEDLGLVLTGTHGFMPFHCLPGLGLERATTKMLDVVRWIKNELPAAIARPAMYKWVVTQLVDCHSRLALDSCKAVCSDLQVEFVSMERPVLSSRRGPSLRLFQVRDDTGYKNACTKPSTALLALKSNKTFSIALVLVPSTAQHNHLEVWKDEWIYRNDFLGVPLSFGEQDSNE